MKNKLGFTLSEMLIALVIIGALGVVLAPIITRMMPDQNKVMIKRSYYVITNTVKAMIDDDNLYSPFGAAGTGNETTPVFKDRPFANTNAVNYNGKDFSGTSKFRGLFMEKIGAKSITNSTYSAKFKSSSASGEVSVSGEGTRGTTKDGIRWTLIDDSTGNVAAYIRVDVNGNRNPNCYEGQSSCSSRTKDFDEYTVAVYNSGKIKVSVSDVWVQDVIDSTSSVSVE